MEIETLKCFIQVAKSLNFTKAAEECHITQTAMSRKISTLEQELSTVLFYRDNRQVELTPAGHEFFPRACNLLEYYYTAIHHTQNVAKGFKSSLKIGIGAYEHILVHSAVKTYCQLYPDSDLSCVQFSYKPLAEQLSEHLIDVMVSTDQYIYAIPEVQYYILEDTPWKIGINRNDKFAALDSISLSELSAHPMITMNDGSHEQIRRAFHTSGFDPYRFYSANSYSTKILMVQAGVGTAILPSFTQGFIPEDIKLLSTIPEFTPRKFSISFLKGNSNPAIGEFIEILEQEGQILYKGD